VYVRFGGINNAVFKVLVEENAEFQVKLDGM